jgi:hypothetical protein
MGRQLAGAHEPDALPRLSDVSPRPGRRGPRGSSPAPRATHARVPVEVLMCSPMKALKDQMATREGGVNRSR